MRLSEGTALGPYEIVGPIGAGGMGEVYRARDTRLGREVALKVLPEEMAANPERMARFEREARSASALNHPNIVTIHDFARDGSDCYLVMELVRGESLREIIARGALPLKKLLAIASGIADGLAAAHAADIVHRDLKPENVMVTQDGTPKICDFGLVKAPSAGSDRDAATEVQMTRSGTVVGTMTYMSPEQAQGQTVGIASDQFALGLMLHEMATGRHPFLRATSYETVTSIIRDDAPSLSGAFPDSFRWIVERCLEKEPGKRYASTADLAHDLEALRTRPASSQATQLHALRAAKPKRSHWWLAAVAAIAIAALGYLLLGRDAAGRASAAPLHLHLATGDLAVGFSEVAVSVAISPDGRYLATQGSTSTGGSELWMTDLRTGSRRLIAENGFGPGWSNDGKSIAFFAEGKLKTMPATGGPARIVCDAPPQGTPAWYGDVILFARYSGTPSEVGIYRVGSSGGVPELLIPVRRQNARSVRLPWMPQFLPGGKRFLYVAMISGRPEIEHEVMIASLDGSPDVRIGAIDSRAVFADGHLLYVRDGTLLAQPFDPDGARFTGDAHPIADDVHYFRSTGMASFSTSENGLLTWRTARRPSRLVWLDRAGGTLSVVDTAAFDGAGRLSPDGKRYASAVLDQKQGTSDLWLYDLERESSDRLTLALLDQKAPLWAPDGKTIFYRSDGNGGAPDIMVLRPGEKPTVLFSGKGVEQPEDVSPDGKFLLLTSSMITSDIQLLPLDPPGPPRDFVATPMNEVSPRFSPDGRSVAYASNISAGRYEVYIRTLEGTGAPQRISQSGGTNPRWSADGTELFFFGRDGQLFSAPVGASIGTPRMLFQAADAVTFEVAPDGQQFLVQMQERTRQPDVQLIVNWPSLLEDAASAK